jgi:hypothetical protein
VESSELIHRIGTVMSGNRVGRMCPVTYVLDDDIDPANLADVMWALGTRIHPNHRWEEWNCPILPWYMCYTEAERHSGKGAIVVHDGLLPAPDKEHMRQATFESLYPADLRARIVKAESTSHA